MPSIRKPRILITGSRGFIGSELVQTLELLCIPFDIVARRGSSHSSLGSHSIVEVDWPAGLCELDYSKYTAVVHLAAAPSSQRADIETLRRQNVEPLRLLVERLRATNPECSLIFTSSQSAKQETQSAYGRLKWEAEELIRQYEGSWTIIRPGLVVGAGSSGLGNRILKIVRKYPIIPLIGDGRYPIQIVDVGTVTKALASAALSPLKHFHKEYALASDAINFRDFLYRSSVLLGKKRLFLPIPVPLINFGLALLERITTNPPLSRSNLLGLLDLELLDSASSFRELKIEPPTVEQLIRAAVGIKEHSLAREANFLHQTLFRRPASGALVSHYINAHEHCCRITERQQRIAIDKICKLRLDAEAIEYATRSRKTLLGKKMLVISYLAELEASNYDSFVNDSSQMVRALFLLAYSTITAPWKMVKGKYLVWRYHLV